MKIKKIIIKILDKLFKKPKIDLMDIWKHKFLMRTIMSIGMIFSIVYFILTLDFTGLYIAIILACSYQFTDFVVRSISRQISKEFELTEK